MLEALQDTSFFTAHTAYAMRDYSYSKRYQVSDITAYPVAIGAPERAEVEAFIADIFWQSYAAKITEFMPELVALRDAEGTLMAAFGLRKAEQGPLFLEQYIDVPIERLMSAQLACDIQRQDITYIGNLAVANPRNASVLIAHVIRHSLEIGIRWAVATAHHRLQNGLVKGGRDVYPLAAANPARLTAAERSKWGRYYQQTPQIVAIRGVADALQIHA